MAANVEKLGRNENIPLFLSVIRKTCHNMNTTQQTALESIYTSLPSLNVRELEDLMKRVVQIRQQKLPNVLPLLETDLLREINNGASASIQKRYDVLSKKRKKEMLTDLEYAELLELNTYFEQHNVRRVELLLELAKIRNQTLDQVIQALEIKPGANVA